VSFLDQLRSQAKALQSQQGQLQLNCEENTAKTEAACRCALSYLEDVARHLNVIGPAAHPFSLDGKTPWPAMKLADFRVDYLTETRGRVVLTPDHDNAALGFRFLNARGFGILNATWPAAMVNGEVLDELAKPIACEPNRFV
jgi:hypothetical protein